MLIAFSPSPHSSRRDPAASDGYPTTRNHKGETTKQYLSHNQLNLFADLDVPRETNDLCSQTWLLLYYSDTNKNELRSELSLPTETDVHGKVCGWKIRILLTPIPLDGLPMTIEPDYSPEIDIDVQLRA